MDRNPSMMKNILVFVAMILVIALLAAVAFFGVDMNVFEIPSVQDGIKLGLDLKGGSIITFEAVGENVSSDNMNIARDMLRQRLDSEGYTEALLYLSGANRIVVEIPDVTDPEEAISMIGSTAELEFCDYTGKVWLTGSAVKEAKAGYGPMQSGGTSQHYVELTFHEEFRKTWAEATMFAAQQTNGSNDSERNNYIALFMDEEMIFDPSVGSEYASTGIDSDSCIVTFSANGGEDAKRFANLVRIGQLPFQLEQVQLSSVGPTLGANSLNTSLMAGVIGIGLIILFMIIFYRLPGVMASLALVFYTVLVAVVLSVMRVNLSLPGIAGIILSIGMAVDANVIIFERIKDELRAGKTIRSACESGYKRALTAIIDSNITTIIAAVVLIAFGTGPIRGFAITLLVGVILSMFTVLVVSRVLLMQMVNLNVTSLPLYGVRKDLSEPRLYGSNFSFVKKFKIFGGISAVICLFAVVCIVLLPFGINFMNFDIDFSGGTSMHFDTKVTMTSEELTRVADIVEQTAGVVPSAPQKIGDTEVMVKTSSIDTNAREAVFNKLKETYPDIIRMNIEDVDPVVGKDLQRSAILSVIITVALMLVYITIRFQFSSGVAAVVALIHDLLVIVAGYVIFQIPINMNFIAVLLTILGYSINSTIVVFDRVRENRKIMQRTPFEDVVDRSTRQTLLRNVNTSLTTLLPIICISVLGVPSVRNFVIPLMIGILAGAYSSICLSGSIWSKIRAADQRISKKA